MDNAARALEKTAAPARAARSNFYVSIALFLLTAVIAGFWPKYFGAIVDSAIRPPHPGWIIHAHAAIFLGWMAVVVIQALLVRRGRTDLHRTLGIIGAGYGAIVIVFGMYASIMLEVHRHSFTHDLDLSARRLLINLGTVVLFAVFFIAAIWQRRTRETHKRLMIVATFSLAAPGIGRVFSLVLHLPPNPLLIQTLFFIPIYICLGWDWKTRKQIHPVYVLGIAANLMLFNSAFIAYSELWQSFGRRVLQLFI